MKYVMFELPVMPGVVRRVPVMFPDVLVHAEVAEALNGVLKGKIVSAGFCKLSCIGVFGKSESIGVSHHKDDDQVINCVDYQHGIQETEVQSIAQTEHKGLPGWTL